MISFIQQDFASFSEVCNPMIWLDEYLYLITCSLILFLLAVTFPSCPSEVLRVTLNPLLGYYNIQTWYIRFQSTSQIMHKQDVLLNANVPIRVKFLWVIIVDHADSTTNVKKSKIDVLVQKWNVRANGCRLCQTGGKKTILCVRKCGDVHHGYVSKLWSTC
jgi:hypothetical protein